MKVNFEKNRQELLEKLNRIRQAPHPEQSGKEAAKADIVLFGEKTPFLDSL